MPTRLSGGPSKKTESPSLLDDNGNLIDKDFLNRLIQYSLDHNINWKDFAERAILVSTRKCAFSKTKVRGTDKSLLVRVKVRCFVCFCSSLTRARASSDTAHRTTKTPQPTGQNKQA